MNAITRYWAGFQGFEDEGMREIAYTYSTSGPFSITSTSKATANVILTCPSVTLDGNTSIYFEWGAASMFPSATAGAWINAVLFDNGTALTTLGGVLNPAYSTGTGVTAVHTPLHQAWRMPDKPAAGAHVYSVGVFVSGGTGTINAGAGGTATDVTGDMPAWMRVSVA